MENFDQIFTLIAEHGRYWFKHWIFLETGIN